MLHTIKNDDFFEIEFLMFFNVVHIVVMISRRIKLKMRLINQELPIELNNASLTSTLFRILIGFYLKTLVT